MKQTLEALVHRCHGDQRPECPILEDLAGSSDEAGAVPVKRAARNGGRDQ